MNLRAIAEGIETARQLERLLELGCEYGQGYYFCQPMEAKAAQQFMPSRSRRRAFGERQSKGAQAHGQTQNRSKRIQEQIQHQRQERRTEPALSEVEGSVRPTQVGSSHSVP
jgi:hypothetical protein